MDSILRLKVESQEYDAKLKQAAAGLTRYVDGCRKVGGTLEVVEKDTLQFVRSIGQMQTASRTATGSLSEMKKTFTDLSIQYKQLTDVEKQSPYGKALSSSLGELKTRILDTKKQLNDINQSISGSKFGQFGSIIDGIGQKMGITGNLTEILTSKTAALAAGYTAAATAVALAAKSWASYNAELNRQDSITSVTTGLKGNSVGEMTDFARSVSHVYGVEFREVINAANTLMSQFGKTGDESIRLIRDGMQGMILGDGPKLLSMIQQYAPAFRDAGISAEQLVAIIHNSEGGLFTAENMNAIVMGIKNIRLMTTATSEALAKLGIDGKEMAAQLNAGTITIFDALQQVSGAIDNVGAGSQVAGEVMQQVFGRQGTAAGTKLGEAIEQLILDLEKTKDQTGDLGESFKALEQATTQMNGALRAAFGVDSWTEFGNNIEIGVIRRLNTLLFKIAAIKAAIDKLTGRSAPVEQPTVAEGMLDGNESPVNIGDLYNRFRGSQNPQNQLRNQLGLNFAPTSPTPPATPSPPLRSTPSAQTATAPEGSILAQEQLVSDLTKKWKEATDQVGRDGYLQQLEAAKSTLATMTGDAAKNNSKAITDELNRLNELADANLNFSAGDRLGLADQIRTELADAAVAIDEASLHSLMKVSIEHGLSDIDFTSLQERMADGLDIPEETWQRLQDEINERLKEMGIDAIQLDFSTGNLIAQADSVAKGWSKAASSVSSVGNALQQIDDPAAKVAGIMLQAISTFILSYTQAAAQASKYGPWVWLGFVASGLATTISTISSLKSQSKYADGGIIPGNSYSGDNINAGISVNAGELILNKAQQGNLASQLGDGKSGLHFEKAISAEEIIFILNNRAARKGRGKYIYD